MMKNYDSAVSAGYLPQEVLVAKISVCLVTGTDFSFVEGENETTIFRGMMIVLLTPYGRPILGCLLSPPTMQYSFCAGNDWGVGGAGGLKKVLGPLLNTVGTYSAFSPSAKPGCL